MSDDEIAWIAGTMLRFDCLLFVWIGRFGPQPVLLPRRHHGPTPLLPN